jgi:hypothetical protein
MPSGQTCKYALLTENQAAFLMTLSRNTPQVVAAKLGLVVAFSRAKELIASATPIATAKPDPFWELIDNATQRGIEPERAIDLHRRMNGETPPMPSNQPKAAKPPAVSQPQVTTVVDVTDFIAKVQSLVDEGLLDGRHVVEVVRRRSSGQKWMAIHGPTVWVAVMARYSMPYDRLSLERSIVQGGGFVDQQTQKFRQACDGPRTAARKCWLVPI